MDLGLRLRRGGEPQPGPGGELPRRLRSGGRGQPHAVRRARGADPDGSIVRYDWDFGDGTLLPNGGPTPQHVYTRPGTYVASLVVTDNEGASTGTVFTGGTVLGAGGPGAQASRNVVVAAAAVRAPPAPPAAPASPHRRWSPTWASRCWPPRCAAEIRVRLPGEDAFQPLQNLEELPSARRSTPGEAGWS